jgi:hypothetical protein
VAAEQSPSPSERVPPEASAREQPTPTFCAKHPSVETYLRCGRCDTPICPRCLIMTPVGARCRDCARLRKLPMFDVRPIHYLRGLGAGTGAAMLGAILLAFLPGRGFFGLILTLALGFVVGEATSAAANRKRGTWLAAVAALAVPLGMILGQMVVLLLFAGGRPGDVAAAFFVSARGLVGGTWDLLILLAAMAVAFSRVR